MPNVDNSLYFMHPLRAWIIVCMGPCVHVALLCACMHIYFQTLEDMRITLSEHTDVLNILTAALDKDISQEKSLKSTWY